MCDNIITLIRKDVEDMTKKMEKEGCEVIEVSDQLDKDMRDAAYKVWQDKDITANFDQDAVEKILKDAGLK